MKIGTDTFRGEVPLLSARALPDAAAQEATNCRMKSGDLEAWRQFLLTYELVGTSGTQRTIYLLDDAWLSFTEQVDIARNVFSGGAAHRIFLTCPALYSTPQYTDKSNATSGSPPFPTITFPLGLPGPTDIPTLVLGVDSTPTTFSIDTTDPGDVLETSWVTSPTRAGSTFSAVTQEAAQGNPSPCYRLHYDEIHNLGEAPFMKRAFGIENASVIHVTAEMRFSGDTSVKNGFMSVAATTTGEGLMVGILSGTLQIRNGTSFEWYNSGAIDNVSAPGLVGGTWYTLDVTMVNNPAPANTQTVTLKLLDGVTEIATVTATNVFTIGGFVGFSAAIPDDSGSVYQTDIDNIHVQASGSTGITPNLTATNYVYTFVNDQGEESTPSFPTADILRPDGVTVNVTTSTTAPSGYEAATTLKRIYRLVSGTTGDLYRFVAEIPLAQADFLDDLTDNELSQTILESQNYDIPPPTLQGIIALPNGIYAGFFEKSLCLSVSGRPHAWPVRQRYPVDSDIVAICNIDNTIVIGTGTFVFTCTGTDPAAYSMSKPGAPQSCQSKLGMTYLDGQGVVFPSPDGWCVCAGSAGFVPVMTEGIFTKEQWEAFNPASIVAACHDGVLHWWHSISDGWDTTNDEGGWIFSNGGFTAEGQDEGINPSAVSVTSRASGKYYFEVLLVDVGGSDAALIGIRPTIPNGVSIRDAGVAIQTTNGDVIELGGSVGTFSPLSTGDVVGIAVDLDLMRVWFSANGVWLTGDPETNTDPLSTALSPGTYYAGIEISGAEDQATLTVRTQAVDFTGDLPSGFTAWSEGVQVSRSGYALDPRRNGFGLIRLSYFAQAIYVDPAGDRLQLLLEENNEPTDVDLALPSSAVVPDGQTIYQFNGDPDNLMVYRWRGKLNLLSSPHALRVARVRALEHTNLVVNFYANAALLKHKVSSDDDTFKLPSKKHYKTYEIEFIGTSSVNDVVAAEDVLEIG